MKRSVKVLMTLLPFALAIGQNLEGQAIGQQSDKTHYEKGLEAQLHEKAHPNVSVGLAAVAPHQHIDEYDTFIKHQTAPLK